MPNEPAIGLPDPVTLARLGRYDLVARMVVDGLLAGLHRSIHHGLSIEFDHHVPYAPGDDLRRLDWRVWARSDRFYLKQYEEETNMRVNLLLDTSGSMAYGSGSITKYQYAATIGAALAHLAIQQRDRVGLALLGETVTTHLPARSQPDQLRRILGALQDARPGGTTGLVDGLQSLAGRLKHRGLMILVSDLMADPEPVTRALQYYRHRKHEVIVLHVLDPAERKFPFEQMAEFDDMETGGKLRIDSGRLRNRYASALREMIQTYRRSFQATSIAYEMFDTSIAFDKILTRYLARRANVNAFRK